MILFLSPRPCGGAARAASCGGGTRRGARARRSLRRARAARDPAPPALRPACEELADGRHGYTRRPDEKRGPEPESRRDGAPAGAPASFAGHGHRASQGARQQTMWRLPALRPLARSRGPRDCRRHPRLPNNRAAETRLPETVMPGLVPGIHVLAARQHERRGWPGQARP